MDKAVDYANTTSDKIERLGVKDFRPSSKNRDEQDDGSESSLNENQNKASMDLEVIGLSAMPPEMEHPEDIRLFIHKKKNDYLRSILE